MLTENQLIALKTILDINTKICVGGSICLKAYGLMDREIGDLDLFIDKKYLLDFDTLDQYISEERSHYDIDDATRISMYIKGVKVDLFRVDSYLISSAPWAIHGLQIQMQNPCLAIAAKVKYSETGEKHVRDIEDLRIKFMNLTNLL